MKKKAKKEKVLGLALGAGGARGLTHLGILKVLHKHKIYPKYLAGTSMGAVIAAAYSVGRLPEDLVEIAKTTQWKEIVDFTVPKAGLIQGKLVERKIRKLVLNKEFNQVKTKLRVVAYNFTKREKVVFRRGDIATAVRASISIPGIFAPVKINRNLFIDGAVANPTPFDVVKDMGADVIVAVDLFNIEKIHVSKLAVKKKSLFSEFREKFITEELLNLKNYLLADRWPKIITPVLMAIFDKLLYPAKVIKMMLGKEIPLIAKIMSETTTILTNNLARERLNCATIDVKVTPKFDSLTWSDFDKVDDFVAIGEKAMEKYIPELKKKLGM